MYYYFRITPFPVSPKGERPEQAPSPVPCSAEATTICIKPVWRLREGEGEVPIAIGRDGGKSKIITNQPFKK